MALGIKHLCCCVSDIESFYKRDKFNQTISLIKKIFIQGLGLSLTAGFELISEL